MPLTRCVLGEATDEVVRAALVGVRGMLRVKELHKVAIVPPVTVEADVGHILSDEFEGSVAGDSSGWRERHGQGPHEISSVPHDIEVPMGSPQAVQQVGEVSASD